MLAVLDVPEFRPLWLAEAISLAGDQLAKVALALLVYDRTGSALWSAVVYALSFLPALAGGLGLSALADRVPRRSLMVGAASIQAVLVALMAVPGLPLAGLCLLLVGMGVAQAPALAAQTALTREIFTSDELYYRSQDLRGVTTNTVMLLGLAGAGLLVAGIGASAALLADAATFVLAALLVRLRVRERPPASAVPIHWAAGIQHVWRRPRLRVLLGLSWLVGLAVVPEGLAAPLAAGLHAPSGAVGWLLAADPLGFVIGTVLLSRFVPTAVRTRAIGGLAVASVGVLVLFALRPSLPVALVLLAVAGAAGAYQVTVVATFTSWVPNEVRGGALGVARTGLRVAQGLGVAAGGAVAELLGSADAAIVAAGVLGVLLAVPAALAWRRQLSRSPGQAG
ncbi:MAG TPA: MFS transporter [Pseudonocardiaceae bacterium]|jgi:predicted MFS family arabinose efflux permease|nr:MFS transporter [Pseudonocardiaceae bacterium]